LEKELKSTPGRIMGRKNDKGEGRNSLREGEGRGESLGPKF